MLVKIAIIDKDYEYLCQIKKHMQEKYIDMKIDIFDNVLEYKKVAKNQTWDLVFVNETINTKIKNEENVFELYENRKEIGNKFFKYQKTSEFAKNVLTLLDIPLEEKVGEEKKEYKKENKDENKYDNKNLYDYEKVYEEEYESYSLEKQEDVKSRKEDEDENEKVKVKDGCKIITIYSPYGGIGKSKNSVKVANMLSKMGETFYLNMEMFSDIDLENYDEGINLINAVYNVDNLNREIFINNLYKKSERLYGFYPIENPYEIMNISLQDIVKVINKIFECGFKYIVIDVDSKVDEMTLKILQESSVVFLLHENSKLKIKRLYNLMSSNEELEKIKNKIIELKLESNDRRNFEKINKTLGALC